MTRLGLLALVAMLALSVGFGCDDDGEVDGDGDGDSDGDSDGDGDADGDGDSDCDPPCDADGCEECVDGECESICDDDEECDGEGTCVDIDTCECDEDACEECVDGECESTCDDDQECDGEGTCVIPEGQTPPGSSCECDADCQDHEGEGVCVGGLCWVIPSIPCGDNQGSEIGCGPGLHCWTTDMGEAIDMCWPSCVDWECTGACDDYDECAATEESNASCNPECASMCFGEPVDYSCSPDRPESGECPMGEICVEGECVEFSCDDTIMEPNETLDDAEAITETVEGLQICEGDDDWFSFAPAEDNVLTQVGIHSFWGSGDIDVEIHGSDGELMAQAWNLPSSYHEDNDRGPLELESFTIHGSANVEDFLLHVLGVSGSTNNYSILWESIPWVDGPSCPDAGFSTEQCRALDAGETTFYGTELVQFPMSHDNDPYVGPGFTFVSGFSWTRTEYIPTGVMWGRRDLVMAMRYAMHVVQEEFPDTEPLGIGEISMPDGTTPGGHPNFTHHYGGNIDFSYFIVPEALPLGQLSYRQICNDAASLDDWSCVDQDGSAGQFGECITGCGDGHIVDIPRTARFMAAVAESGRIRVFGVDTSVADELAAEFESLDDKGVAGAITARDHMASAADDSSWVWHFNHIHLSFD